MYKVEYKGLGGDGKWKWFVACERESLAKAMRRAHTLEHYGYEVRIVEPIER